MENIGTTVFFIREPNEADMIVDKRSNNVD